MDCSEGSDQAKAVGVEAFQHVSKIIEEAVKKEGIPRVKGWLEKEFGEELVRAA